MAPTMFFPKSCRSPFTVHITTSAFACAASFCANSAGSMMALHALKTSAEATTSGRNTSPRFHISPRSNMATAIPSSSTILGSAPAAINASAADVPMSMSATISACFSCSRSSLNVSSSQGGSDAVLG